MMHDAARLRHTLKILHIEDKDADVEVVRAMLQRGHKQGFEVDVQAESSLSEGLIALENEPFDVALLDLDLPDSKGVATLQALALRFPQLPIVVVTATPEQEAGIAAVSCGADDYLVKGKYSYADLMRVIRYAVGRKRAAVTQVHAVQRIDTVTQALSDAIIVVDQQGTILFANLTAHRLLDVPFGLIKGQSLGAFFTSKSYEQVAAAIVHQDCAPDTRVVSVKAGGGEPLEVRMNVVYWHDTSQPYTSLFLSAGQQMPLTQARLRSLIEVQSVVATISNMTHFDASLETKLDQALMAVLSMSFLRADGRLSGALYVLRETYPALTRAINLELTDSQVEAALDMLAASEATSSSVLIDGLHWIQLPVKSGVLQACLVLPVSPDARQQNPVQEMSEAIPFALAALIDEHQQMTMLCCLSQAVKQSPSGVLITDEQGNIEFANDAMFGVSGFRPDELIGQNTRVFRSGFTDQQVYEGLWKDLNQGKVWRGELQNKARDGELYWEALTISPVTTGTGVRHFVAVKENIEKRKRTEEQLISLTTHDALTGLPNRSLVLDRLGQALTRARRERTGTALLMIDLDLFKLVNEQHGHLFGDALLKEVSSRIQAAIRKSDTVGRQGGDEFIVVVTDLPHREQAERIALLIRNRLIEPYEVLGASVLINCSVGIAYCDTGHSGTEEIYRQADTALYEVKERGGQACGFFTQDMDEQISLRNWFRLAIKQAMSEDEFFLVYQPKINLSSGMIIGAEALIRWQHPDKGLIRPDTFIPMAEESGHILELGRWVIEEACRQMRSWLDDGLAVPRISVNLSAQQLRDETLVEFLEACLARYQLTPDYLDVELTESEMMQSPALAIDIMTRIQQLGISISGDDFGTGYSSLSYLKRLPMDLLKIDRSFVMDITSDADSLVIASMIVSLGHDLGLKVLAEGIETEEQLALLRRLGCDEFQGYLGSPPVKASDFAVMLEQGAPLIPPYIAAQNQKVLLLVDDEPGVLKSLKRVTRSQGYQVLVAQDGEEALAVLAKHPVGVILSDQRMPKMSGAELMAKVKVMYPAVTRMILSGYADIKDVVEAVNSGAIYKFLCKPWDDEALLAHLDDAFLLHEVKQKAYEQRTGDIRNMTI